MVTRRVLALDLGNTQLKVGVMEAGRFVAGGRLSTDRRRTADEYGVLLWHLVRESGPTEAVLSSVVPPLTEVVRAAVEQYLGIPTRVVGVDLAPGLELDVDAPEEVGADRIVNGLGALAVHAPPIIVVSFGTATTFDALDPRGAFVGGAIAPGVGIAVDALFEAAAKLPRVELKAPRRAIGRSTADNLRSGIVFGYASLVDGMVQRMRSELGSGAWVVGTGGLMAPIAAACTAFDALDPELALRGLERLALGGDGGG